MAEDKIFDEQPPYVRGVRRFWTIDPFMVFGVCFLLGVIPLIYAVFASPIGSVAYCMSIEADTSAGDPACADAGNGQGAFIKKQVGYAYAINWWPTLVILMPLALFFAFESVQNMQEVFKRMRKDRMFCDSDWIGEDSESLFKALKSVVHQVWKVFAIGGVAIFLLVASVTFLDWFCVVHWPLILERTLTGMEGSLLDGLPQSCRNPDAFENDWSISATFGQPESARLAAGYSAPEWWSNYIFSGYVYLLLLIEMGALLAYFSFIFALSYSIYRIRRGAFDLRIVPNLRSPDSRNRMGFENFELVFRPCVYVTILSFIMAFLMRIQNEYLRHEKYQVIHDFIFEDIRDALRSLFDIDLGTIGVDLIDVLKKLGSAIEAGAFEDPNALIGAPVVVLVFSLVSVALGVLLRDTARDAKTTVAQGLGESNTAIKVTHFYGLDEKEIKTRLARMETWPLSWPRLRQSIELILAGLVCYVFYRLALIWVGVVAVRAIRGKLSDSGPAGGDPRGDTPQPPPQSDDGPNPNSS